MDRSGERGGNTLSYDEWNEYAKKLDEEWKSLDEGRGVTSESGEVERRETEPTPADIRRSLEKARQGEKKGIKKYVAGAVLAAFLFAQSTGMLSFLSNDEKVDENVLNNNQKRIESRAEEQERIGIYDGYGEKGMYLDEEKTHPNNFGHAGHAMEVCGGDIVETVKYTAENEVEAMACYLASMPNEVKPQDWKNLTIKETEEKLESMSVNDFETIQTEFNNILDEAVCSPVILKGQFNNTFIKPKNPDGPINHENMRAVRVITNEDGTLATKFAWEVETEDGRKNVCMFVKISKAEGTEKHCLNALVPAWDKEWSIIYRDLPDLEPRPDPTPEKPNIVPPVQPPVKPPEKPNIVPNNPEKPQVPEKPNIVPPVVPPTLEGKNDALTNQDIKINNQKLGQTSELTEKKTEKDYYQPGIMNTEIKADQGKKEGIGSGGAVNLETGKTYIEGEEVETNDGQEIKPTFSKETNEESKETADKVSGGDGQPSVIETPEVVQGLAKDAVGSITQEKFSGADFNQPGTTDEELGSIFSDIEGEK